jgi:hypothetical protein
MDIFAFTRRGRRLATVSLVSLLAAGSSAAAQVQATSLGELDLWSPAARDTGLPTTLWRDSSGALARAVVQGLPEKPMNPAAAALARRTLATGATAPAGLGDDAPAAAARARALMTLGDVSGVATILGRTPRLSESEPLSRLAAEAALLQERDEAACDVGRALRQDRDGLWWLKLRSYCHMLTREPGAAQVTLDLWRQQGGKDAAFDRIMTAGVTGGNPTGPGSTIDPLTFQLSRRMGLDLSGALADAPVWALTAIADAPAAPLRLRAAAAQRARRLGAIPAETARRIYSVQAGEVAPAAPVTGEPNPEPPLVLPTGELASFVADATANGEAALYTLAAGAPDIGQRQGAAIALLRRAKPPGEFQALSRLLRPVIASVAQAGVALEDPVLFATAAAAAGDAATAGRIRASVNQDTVVGSTALDLALLDGLIVAAGGEGAGPTLDRLIERGAVGDAKLRLRAQGAALLVSALGAGASPDARAQFATFDVPAGKASAARLAAMALAAETGAQGDTALYVLSVAQQQGPALALADRARIVQALRRVGLEAEARAFAVEGVLGLMGR